MAQFGTVITNIGLAKITNAQITQETVGIKHMVLGDGNGAYYTLSQSQTSLRREVWRGLIADEQRDPSNLNRIAFSAYIPSTAGGFTIREVGLLDTDGNLIAVSLYPEQYKPQLAEGVSDDLLLHFVLETSNASVVTLAVDPTIIIASRKYVDDKVAGAIGDIGTNLSELQQQVTTHLDDFEYQTPTINGTQIQLTKQSETSRLFFKLSESLSGNITISIDGGLTEKPLLDVDGKQVTSIDKGFAEVVEDSTFFTLRSRGISSADLQALIAIVNEAERNESDLKAQFVNAVNTVDKDGGINLPESATWADILAVMPNIKTGKKRASGTFTLLPSGNITEVIGLSFKPTIVITFSEEYRPDNSGQWLVYRFVYVDPALFAKTHNNYLLAEDVLNKTMTSGGVDANKLKIGNNITVGNSGNSTFITTSNGFKMDFKMQGMQMKYLAFE